jgi:hypothetical protein
VKPNKAPQPTTLSADESDCWATESTKAWCVFLDALSYALYPLLEISLLFSSVFLLIKLFFLKEKFGYITGGYKCQKKFYVLMAVERGFGTH